MEIIIIEPHHYLREAWISALEPEHDMHITACFNSLAEAVNSTDLKITEIAVINSCQTEISLSEGISQLLQRNKHIAILLVASTENGNLLFQALKSGAAGYVEKQVSPAKLTATIRDIYNGISPLTPPVAQKIKQYLSKRSDKQSYFTPKEIHIIHEIARGVSYSTISEEFLISVDLIQYHIRQIYCKLQKGV